LHRVPHRLSFLFVVAFVFALVLTGEAHVLAAPARAEPTVPACLEEKRQLEVEQDRLRVCAQAKEAAAEKVEQCQTEVSRANRRSEEASSALESCQSTETNLCTATGGLVQALLEGKTSWPSLGACSPPATQASLADLVAAWSQSQASLARLEAFARGDTEQLPSNPPAARAAISSLVRRLTGNARTTAPLVYRRLLVEAVRLVAPRFFRRLRASGNEATDAWFASGNELDAAFVTEAQAALAKGAERGADKTSSASGPPQSAALRFVQTYRELVRCPHMAHLHECVRAGRLQAFLESSAPLIVRQREQEIWRTGCATLNDHTVLGWLREFPAPQPSVGRAEWQDLTQAAWDKLVSCYLAEPDEEDARFGDWLATRLPRADALTEKTLDRVDELRAMDVRDGLTVSCLNAVQTLRTLPPPVACELPVRARERLQSWFERAQSATQEAEDLATRACSTFVGELWRGLRPRVAGSFEGSPLVETLVRVERGPALPAVSVLRARCRERRGSVKRFPEELAKVATVARLAGEHVAEDPWRFDEATSTPREASAFESSVNSWELLRRLVRGGGACDALSLPLSRCQACAEQELGATYDCGLLNALETQWKHRRRVALGAAGGVLATGLFLSWLLVLGRARRRFGAWREELRSHLVALGLVLVPDRLAYVRPSHLRTLRLSLPRDGSWERWGEGAVVLRTQSPHKVNERGPRRAVHVLAVSHERLRWARTRDDLLDLVEQTSLRGNPFEVRGRLVSSSQFFNRERLVSGLLAASQAGHWTVVTGLRRFGKSSLSLEVARRLQGPHAYVDLAGFHHEVAASGDPSRSAEAILRYVLEQLHASAVSLFTLVDEGVAALPALPPPERAIDAGFLLTWMRGFLAACRRLGGARPLAHLVIFDEVEQAMGVGPERIAHAIDVVSIVVGRLRACLTDGLLNQSGDRVGVLFCSALHPLLWAPLTTLSQQSLLGAFPSVFVPRLPDEAAFAMMRGLGARQGIRFTEQALALIVREAQGIPILVRRIGSAVLELYDPERARQGSLGAVEIGVEGASAAVAREEQDGAPLRVWVESEIGDIHNPAGVLLRRLAREGTVSFPELKAQAAEVVRQQFHTTGIATLLSPDEVDRRAQEAAGFVLRMLDEVGLLEAQGNLTQPDAFRFPDTLVRRILATDRLTSPFTF